MNRAGTKAMVREMYAFLNCQVCAYLLSGNRTNRF